MGQKVSPIGLRIGINKDWESKWYAGNKDFAKYLNNDNKIRKFFSSLRRLRQSVKLVSIIINTTDTNDAARELKSFKINIEIHICISLSFTLCIYYNIDFQKCQKLR